MRLILASASPRRAELLAAAGFAFDIMTMDIDERPQQAERPDVYVRRLAQEKSLRAMEAMERTRESFGSTLYILGADTSVVIDGEILGKPGNAEDARSMLRRLSGRRHEVLTGVSLRRCEQGPESRAATCASVELICVETTAVFFAPIGNAEVDWYVQSGEGSDKAGGYAIQGLASRFVERIEGSYSNVVGLPVAAVHRMIRQAAERRI